MLLICTNFDPSGYFKVKGTVVLSLCPPKSTMVQRLINGGCFGVVSVNLPSQSRDFWPEPQICVDYTPAYILYSIIHNAIYSTKSVRFHVNNQVTHIILAVHAIQPAQTYPARIYTRKKIHARACIRVRLEWYCLDPPLLPCVQQLIAMPTSSTTLTCTYNPNHNPNPNPNPDPEPNPNPNPIQVHKHPREWPRAGPVRPRRTLTLTLTLP